MVRMGTPSERRWFTMNPQGEAYSARTGHSVVEYKRGFYLFGGTDKLRRQQDLYRFDVEERTWTQLQANGDIPSRRSGAIGIEYNGLMYVFGGYEGREQAYFNTVHSFDFEKLHWSLIRPNRSSAEQETQRVSNSSVIVATQPHPRTDHCLVAHQGKLIVFGGYDGYSRYNDTWVFDLATRKWKEIALAGNRPSKRFGHTGIVHDGHLWIFGGWDGRDTLDCVWALNLTTETWSSLETMRQKRWGEAANPAEPSPATLDLQVPFSNGVLRKRARTPSGDGENRAAAANSSSSAERTADGKRDVVVRKPAYADLDFRPRNRYRHTAIVHDDSMLVFGGVDKDHLRFNDLVRFDIPQLCWETVDTTGLPPSSRTFHRAVMLGQRMFVLGGYDGVDRLNDMHYVYLGPCSPPPLVEICADRIRRSRHELARSGVLQHVPSFVRDSLLWTRDPFGELRGGRWCATSMKYLCPRLELLETPAEHYGALVQSRKRRVSSVSSLSEQKEEEENDVNMYKEGISSAQEPDKVCALCGESIFAHDLIDEDGFVQDVYEEREPDLELAAWAEASTPRANSAKAKQEKRCPLDETRSEDADQGSDSDIAERNQARNWNLPQSLTRSRRILQSLNLRR